MTSIASASVWWRAIRLAIALSCWTIAAASFTATAQITDSYRIQPTDILVVEVVNEPQLAAKEFRVSSNGEISYPFIGAIKSANRTTTEIEEDIKRLLEADYLVNAQVLVQVKEFRKEQFSVLGQVNRPGLYDIPNQRKLTVIQALTMAGGHTRLARTSHIELTRQGQTEPRRFSLEDLRNPDKEVYVEPGDVIFVPESRI